MEKHLFILLFFTGVVPLIQSVPHKYYLIQEKETWSNAQAYCRTHHTDLAIIESDDNMIKLQEEIQNQQFSSSAWIGLYRELVDWYWSHGTEPLGNMTPWRSREPDMSYNLQCVRTYSDGWDDCQCTTKEPFICFNETKTDDQRYIYISTAMPWYKAQAYCRNHYTDLATVRNETEHSVMLGLISGWTWIGLIRESWRWINQTTFSTISWKSGEPDLTKNDETCGFINNGVASDTACSATLPFICYSDITGQQKIMRMEVRSNKDVNDPAVMDAIMERIQKKLEERGLADTVTVKWRVQPDGKVFHKKKKEDRNEIAKSLCES